MQTLNGFSPIAVSPAKLPSVLGLVLATTPEQPADRLAIEALQAYLDVADATVAGFRCGPPDHPTAATVTLRLPGRTAVVLTAFPEARAIDPAAQSACLDAALRDLATRDPHYAQVLLEPTAATKARLITAAGFAHITTLEYRARGSRFPWVEPPADAGITWTAYSPATHDRFAATIAATYEDSQDCPELTGLRPMDDVIAAHQASGAFDPGLWELALRGDTPAGVLLLARLPDATSAEIAYMGVTPPFRGQGLGKLLLRRALEQCRSRGLKQITIVADERNTAARGLYQRFAFRVIGRRDAYLLPRDGLQSRYREPRSGETP